MSIIKNVRLICPLCGHKQRVRNITPELLYSKCCFCNHDFGILETHKLAYVEKNHVKIQTMNHGKTAKIKILLANRLWITTTVKLSLYGHIPDYRIEVNNLLFHLIQTISSELFNDISEIMNN